MDFPQHFLSFDKPAKIAYTINNSTRHASAWIECKAICNLRYRSCFLVGLTLVCTIISGHIIKTLIITILAYTFVTVVLQSAISYIDSGFEFRKWILRTKVSHELSTKDITTDYANLEEERCGDLKWRSAGQTRYGNGAPEQIYNIFTNIGINIFGFIIYIILLVSVNPLVLLITAVTTIFGVVIRRHANKWEYEHNSEAGMLSWQDYTTRQKVK